MLLVGVGICCELQGGGGGGGAGRSGGVGASGTGPATHGWARLALGLLITGLGAGCPSWDAAAWGGRDDPASASLTVSFPGLSVYVCM